MHVGDNGNQLHKTRSNQHLSTVDSSSSHMVKSYHSDTSFCSNHQTDIKSYSTMINRTDGHVVASHAHLHHVDTELNSPSRIVLDSVIKKEQRESKCPMNRG